MINFEKEKSRLIMCIHNLFKINWINFKNINIILYNICKSKHKNLVPVGKCLRVAALLALCLQSSYMKINDGFVAFFNFLFNVVSCQCHAFPFCCCGCKSLSLGPQQYINKKRDRVRKELSRMGFEPMPFRTST